MCKPTQAHVIPSLEESSAIQFRPPQTSRLLSFLEAGLFLYRRRDLKRMFGYSSIEHMGLMTFAFGLGGPLATFGALPPMLVHSLTKSAPDGLRPVSANMPPVAVHLGPVLWLGLAIPGFLARWLDRATELITGSHLL